ncbi:acyl-CoA synthetase [Streptomyces sp. MUM 178J]|uniref:acyl-CoA synthetase n=1 Tax=Streptomyces sp. MUM 178J TaxID=2791991 RepID=UPI001F0408A7|nr:acyl-CoA synthetase [Streptomyces sp. MUM 178J]WRQ83296.1 acyl-CoA synthetase [Streptomyces sp. MUM 178J]
MSSLFPRPVGADRDRVALRFPGRSLTYGQLAAAAHPVAERLEKGARVAVWATPTPQTAIAVVGALLAGAAVVPLNPKSGERELAHVIEDSAPAAVLAAPGEALPDALGALPRVGVTAEPPGGGAQDLDTAHEPALPAFVVYTSGTTGPPKGAVLPRRAVAATLDALADAWAWTADDVLVHGLPLFHVHGLILGVLGPLRRGGELRHLGSFTPRAAGRELASGGTMLFGVPTMYHRLAQAAEEDGELATALADARLLVSGSAALPLHDHERMAAATGRRVVERYGMTETLMLCSPRVAPQTPASVRADGPARPGTVGLPLPGVELRLVADDGTEISVYDGETIGEIQVRGDNLFTEYLNRPDATFAAFDGTGPRAWFRTGDMAVRDPDGCVRIVGRKATDLIKSGGYKIGAGEIENALLDHPGVREAAVTGEPDADLGERVVAWIVPADPRTPPSAEELAEHVAGQLAPHKRPRAVRCLDALPRNDMGKVIKSALGGRATRHG